MAWFGPGERSLAMSIRQTAVPAGAGIGAVMLPALAARAGFAWVYGTLAALCVLSVILTMAWVREPEEAAAHESARAEQHEVSRAHSPLRRVQVWRMVGGIAALRMPQVAVISFASVFLHDFGHAGRAATGTALVAVQRRACASGADAGLTGAAIATRICAHASR